ncbi:uncharacterized protein DS421_11g328700 [Arachis hypogaea]|nr:uncharacterized protein DS421_11g328700 [Arachis hypogaea]
MMDDGESALGFVVVLPHTRFGIKVTAEDMVSTDERKARQDASSKMLGEIVLATKLKIVDCNHQRVQALEGEVADLKQHVESLHQWLWLK